MSTETVSASVVPEVFISYSSKDRDKISPIVQIVRAMKKGLVFQDYTNIIPGERWRERVMDAIQKAMTLVVFWCQHSAASKHVREEYEVGIEWRKEIVPILLDDTELPNPLRSFHWIDLQKSEPHRGLSDFVYRTFRRSGRHYYPTDEHGEFRDWDHETFIADEPEEEEVGRGPSAAAPANCARDLDLAREVRGLTCLTLVVRMGDNTPHELQRENKGK